MGKNRTKLSVFPRYQNSWLHKQSSVSEVLSDSCNSGKIAEVASCFHNLYDVGNLSATECYPFTHISQAMHFAHVVLLPRFMRPKHTICLEHWILGKHRRPSAEA